MSKAYTIEWFKENLDDLSESYYKDSNDAFGITIKNKTSKKVEKIAETYLRNGQINSWVVAWKLGKLDAEGEIIWENASLSQIKTRYGSVKGIQGYIQKIDIPKIQDLICKSEIFEAYEILLANAPDNFGAVNIINLLYFISKGEIPIYDSYAHKAVKALHMGKPVSQVYIGNVPDKQETRDVINMLEEYMTLIKILFKDEIYRAQPMYISRKIDRALWVYGHDRIN